MISGNLPIFTRQGYITELSQNSVTECHLDQGKGNGMIGPGSDKTCYVYIRTCRYMGSVRRKYKQLHCKIHLPQSCPSKTFILKCWGKKTRKKYYHKLNLSALRKYKSDTFQVICNRLISMVSTGEKVHQLIRM